ncbi:MULTISPECIES: response regulator [Pseudomonas]|jgi:two-component system copper resistance phosphate regulon response regulator CusR|uniref:Response regulator n=1 Tax=Pseudomonas grimontii TaxID=129847 RepID=A0A1H1D1T9_9PSED|nr:response regulator [Pseudomonas grimontii]MCS3514645.1 two-component system copper resistance phosphate regulon response regulator CusR [Pseudomonas grimontii]TWR53402.1 response regulator [Pseudomonas grimontii]SDQ69756.1 two-component system, OmpR family, copper resistance phosphate regulon response regulator CusR [Pseudomonas grimontii]
MRVLLVEHESEEAQRMAQGLSEAGYTVEVAANGMAAQRFVESAEYDLVVLDVMLPGLNAWKLQQAIRQKGETPVLFLTTPGGIEDRLRGLELHEDDYLLKPFEAKVLVMRVKKLLRRDRGR